MLEQVPREGEQSPSLERDQGWLDEALRNLLSGGHWARQRPKK